MRRVLLVLAAAVALLAPAAPVQAQAAPAPTTLTAFAAPAVVPAGRATEVSGRLRRDGVGAAGLPTQLLARVGGTATVRVIGAQSTGAGGVLRYRLVPRVNTEYRLRFAGDSTAAAVTSAPVVAQVQPRVSLALVPARVDSATATTLTGVTTPAYSGVPLELQRRVGSSWQRLKGLRTDGQGRFTTRYGSSLPGSAALRVVLPRAAAHLGAASPVRSLSVVSTPVVQRGDGRLVTVPGTTARSGSGQLRRYSVAVEGGLGVNPAWFADAVAATLADRRSWGAGGRLSFQRVDSGPVDIRVVLASPALTDRMCAPLRTGGTLSCATGRTAVLNSMRWLRGADAYGSDLAGYRQYLANHEVGHTLGHHHAACPGQGAPAPVMMQQTKGIGACRPNPWPYP